MKHLSSKEKTRLRAAIRKAFLWSDERKKVVNRCKVFADMFQCEACGAVVPKKEFQIDHTVAAGALEDPGFLLRMFPGEDGLKGLCKPCHKEKTKKDNAETRRKKNAKKTDK